MKPKKNLGQNFLKDTKVLDEFTKACEFSKEDVVVEVGGGTGVVTKAIAPLVKKLVTYEFDKSLSEQYLNPLESKFDNLEIKNQDVLDACLPPDISIVCGAIPYQISSPLLHKVVRGFYWSEKRPKVVFIIQKEVAQKICSKSSKAAYLSNFVNLYGDPEIIGSFIDPSAFFPEPKVKSAILKITPHSKKLINPKKLKQFEMFLHHGFKNPRKMLNKVFDINTLEKADIDPNLRPQTLSLAKWVQLFGIVEA